MDKDRIYSAPLAQIADFRFDAQVADVFADMIGRSVPGYGSIIAMIETLAGLYAQPGSTLYDLGCSLGAATLSMRRGVAAEGCRIVAVDNAEAMAGRCRKAIARDGGRVPVEVLCDDILRVAIADASMVVLNFTLQFVPTGRRAGLLARIAQGMRPGGVLVLSEKVVFGDARHDRLMAAMHHGFKRAHGYSDLEISQKRAALEKVLVPETIAAHRERLLAAGFSSCDAWFQCLNFMSMLAVK